MAETHENSNRGPIRLALVGHRGIGWLALSIAGPSALAWLVIHSPDRFIYDEVGFVKYVAMLHQYGFSREFLLSLPEAPGPLVGIVQFLFSPITNLEPVRMRLVNFALLLLIVACLWKMQPKDMAPNFLRPLILALAVPMTWVLSGLALSEIPAIVFVTLSLLLLLSAIESNVDQVGGFWSRVILSGLCLGIATWGRQPYVLLIGIPILLAWQKPLLLRPALLYCGIVLACFVPLVLVWGGLVPPRVQGGDSEEVIAVEHMLLSLGYTGIVFFLLAPNFFFRISKRWALGGLSLVILINVWLQIYEFYPLRSVIENHISESIVAVYGAVCAGALFSIGFLFALLLLKTLWGERKEPRKLVAYSGLLICALHPLFVTAQYSSRYAAMSLPYMILAAYQWPSGSYLRLTLACLGTALGAVSLLGYYEA